MTYYSYNIRHEVTMLDLCNIKQKHGEPFLTFLQRWRHLLSKYPRNILESERMEIFIQNLTPDMSYKVQLQCPPTFKKLIENGVKIEEAMVKKRELKLYTKDNATSSGNNNSNNPNDQSKY